VVVKNEMVTRVVTPYQTNEVSKKQQVAGMFDNIAGRYDFLNHFLSFGADILWRKKAVNLLKPFHPLMILDIATGTGDFAIESLKLNPAKVIGIDISEKMLEVGRKKLLVSRLDQKIELMYGDSEAIELETGSIDAVTVGFGVRNFEHLEKGISEIHRVLKPGGAAVILEPAIPKYFPMRQMFFLYFKGILPLVGRLISRDRHAYRYLPESVQNFPQGKEFVDICTKAGFKKTTYKPLTLGICALYLLER